MSSTEQVSARAKEALKSVKELLQKVEETTTKELDRVAPSVAKSLNSSFDAAAKGFASTLKTIDSRTGKEQLELLSAYRRFLAGQLAYVDSKLDGLKQKATSKDEQTPA